MNPFWKDKTVLVTGAGGFIGSHLVEALLARDAQVRAYVRYTSRRDPGLLRDLSPADFARLEVVSGDLRDERAVRESARGVQIVFHLGALISIPYSYRHPLEVAETYSVLGIEHILLGIDHLLFVLGLLLLVRGFIPLVKTVTAFTVAHSITLAASVLGYIPLDRAPIEAAIALSIVLLAREIVVADRGLVHLTHRKPWVVAFVFGLLHGLGFAGALGEIGLPASAIPLALLFFNLGVEAGQLAFVVVLLVLHRLLHARLQAALPRMKPALGYSLGALAALWFFERLPAIWGS